MSEENQGQETDQNEIETIPKSDIETMASKQGWNPDKGDKTALEFLGDGREYRDRLYSKVEKAEKESAKAHSVIAEFITRQDKKDYENEKENVEGKIKNAADAGDSDKVLELTKKLPKEPAKKEDDPNISIIDNWIVENKWFNESPKMKADALGFYQSETAQLGNEDPSVVLPIVLQRIKKEYPNKFTATKENENRGSGAEGSGKHKTSKKTGLTKADLTEEEAMHLDQFVASGISEEKLLKSISVARAEQ